MTKVIYDIISGTPQAMISLSYIERSRIFPRYDISKEGILHSEYSFVSNNITFTNMFFTIEQDQTSLLNHYLGTLNDPEFSEI